MIKKLLIGALSLSALNSNSQAIANVAWKQFFSERSNIANVPSAIDAGNNVYQTGYTYPTSPSNQDATTIKYDAAGTFQFSVSYDNGGVDNSKAIILDPSGSFFYITGESDGVGTGRDIFTAKYTAAGVLVWVQRFNNTTANGNDVGNAITLDASGNIFVTGYTTNSSGNRDYITIGYSSSGTQLFAVTFAGAGNGNDEAIAIAYNSSRLYITGTSVNASGNSDLVTLRLNPTTGATVWSKSENGTANTNDMAYALITDGNDVVVVGNVNNTITGNDYITVKYNGNTGATLFNKKYDFANSNNIATAIVKDATGNYAVTGISLNGTIYEYHTLLYSNSGVQQWVNKVSTGLTYSSAMPQIAVDPIANHFYVCGQVLGTSSDIFVYQITPGGNKTWDEKINGAMNGQDAAVDLVVNSTGDIYIAGASLNSTAKFDYATIKINQTPVYFPIDFNNANEPYAKNSLFYPNLGQVFNSNNQVANKVNFYSTNTYPQFFFNNDNSLSFLSRRVDSVGTIALDSTERIDLAFIGSNNLTKTYQFDVQNNNYLNFFKGNVGGANGLTDVKGGTRLMIPNIYPNIDLHYYSNKDGLKMYFVVKPGGNPKQIRLSFNGTMSTSLNSTNELSVSSNLTKFGFKTPKIYNVTMALTTPTIGGTLANISGNIYSVNTNTYNTTLPLVIELEQKVANQSQISTCDWSTFYGGSGYEIPNKVITDVLGNSFLIGGSDSPSLPNLTGGYTTTTLGFDAFLIKLNPNGGGVFGTYFGGSGNSEGFGAGVNSLGEIYLSGYSADPLLPIVPSGNSTLNGSQDVFLAKFNSSGNSLLFSRYFGGNGYDYNDAGMSIDVSDNVYIAGLTESNSGFPFPTANPSGSYNQLTSSASSAYPDGFIAKFNVSNVLIWSSYFGGSGKDAISAIKTLPNGNILTSGVTGSTTKASLNTANTPCSAPISNSEFPDCVASGAYTQNFGGGFQDNFVAEFNSNGTLVWSTYFGGGAQENNPSQIVLNPSNPNIFYLVGGTGNASHGNITLGTSSQYTQNYPTFSGSRGYITKFVNRARTWGSLLGDGSNVFLFDGVCDATGNVYVTGEVKATGYYSSSCVAVPSANSGTDFPKCFPAGVFNQPTYGGGFNGDAFLMGFNPNDQLVWSTFFGSNGTDRGRCLAYDNVSNKLCFAGINADYSSGFPILDPAIGNYQQNTNNGSTASFLYPTKVSDAFFAKLCLNNIPAVGIKENSFDKLNFASVYPNPNTGDFNVMLTDFDSKNCNYQLFDVTGKLIEAGTKDISEKNLKFNLSNKNYKQGIYLLKISSKEKTALVKFIIE